MAAIKDNRKGRMGWFEHQHYWRPKTALNQIMDPSHQTATGGLILEDCECGAVRQIEFYPGKAPIVRVTTSNGEER